LAPEVASWIDLGSGGGFPGAVIAIIAAERRQCAVTMVESNAKKAAFLRTSLGIVGAPADVEQARIEECPARERTFDVVSARALAPLPKLLGLAEPWLRAGARGLFHKGRDYRREIEESRDEWDCDLLVHASSADPESVVVEVSNLRRKPRKSQ
jgi:16S rRNA (guanine527-N7)-methyltransferase